MDKEKGTDRFKEMLFTSRVKGKSYFSLFILSLFTSLILSCSDADNTYYRGARVRFSYSATNTVPELNAALGSMGEFCSIRCDAVKYIFTSPRSSTSRPLTAVDTRVNPALGLSGLIVGLPNIPELGADVPRVVAFDLACPCYEDFNTTRNLQFAGNGRAACTRCGRTYDLNNLGIVVEGPAGRSLYRYRATYNQFGNTLSVNN